MEAFIDGMRVVKNSVELLVASVTISGRRTVTEKVLRKAEEFCEDTKVYDIGFWGVSIESGLVWKGRKIPSAFVNCELGSTHIVHGFSTVHFYGVYPASISPPGLVIHAHLFNAKIDILCGYMLAGHMIHLRDGAITEKEMRKVHATCYHIENFDGPTYDRVELVDSRFPDCDDLIECIHHEIRVLCFSMGVCFKETPGGKFLNRDGDHAIMFRVMRMLTN